MTRSRWTARRAAALAAVMAAMTVALAAQPPSTTTYFPSRGDWQKKDPAAVGLDKARLDDAIAFAVAHENPDTKDLAVAIVKQFRSEAPYNTLIGPAQPRAGSNGIIIRHGAVAAAWGDTGRADMTFSVTKTFLSTVVGLAFDRGRIRSVTDRVGPYMPAGVDLFTSEHNAPITWDHLLRQTSDWSGTLWGKPDWADRPPREQTPEQWAKRELHAPGTFYKYNDTRVNVLALSALYVLKQPLPDVLKASIMDPIGASSTWHWEAYDNAWVEIDGKRMKSVTGGGHFGGGMFISADDLARFGYLFLNNGKWDGQQLISEKWIAMARTPGVANEGYGFCNWFLNNPEKG
ncbi:MAG: serine hydrolase, partial [Acidobacteriota bacterium]|nr:serine hydrolase [Acidobacteriota bacterium]